MFQHFIPHKNKEIKRMLSKKMAFSLMSLITIFALAFVVTPAMAGDFSTDISVAGHDISHADGQQRVAGTELAFNVTFGKVVTTVAANAPAENEEFAVTDLILQAYDEDGAIEALPSLTISAGIPNNGKNYTITLTPGSDVRKLYLQIPQGTVGAADPTVGDADDANKKKDITVHFLTSNPDGAPDVLKVARVGEPYATITSAEFMVHVLLTEEPKGGFKKDHLELKELDFGSIVKLASPAPADVDAIPAVDRNGDNDTNDTGETAISAGSAAASWRDGKLHLYLVTVKTKPGEKTAVVGVKSFAGMENPAPGVGQEMYNQLTGEGRDQLTVKTKTAVTAIKPGGIEVKLLKDGIIPKDGYFVVAKSQADSAIRDPGDQKKSPVGTARQPFALTYNLNENGGLINLERFLTNGGTIDLVAPQKGLVISEIMWGSDASIADSFKSQWIEIRNTSGAEIKMGDGTHKLLFYPAGSALPDVSTVSDRVGTVGAGGYWSIDGKGQSGRTGIGEAPGDAVAVTPTKALVSMQRSITAGVADDGTMESSWAASVAPASNFELTKEGTRIGSPGRAPVAYPVAPTPEPEPTAAPVVPVAGATDIMITEIMVDTGNGRLPQWIELTNVSGAEKSLAGWSLAVVNSDADADVIGSSVSINLSGTIGVGGGAGAGGTMGKSIVLAAGTGRSSSNLGSQVMDVSSQLGQKGRYKLISDMAFMVALVPPQTTGVLTYGDVAGNLDAAPAWDIKMDENGRSSLIRVTEAGVKGVGTAANGWILASSTALVGGPTTWYGSDEDAGTPGYDAGGPLPVELSHFRPARDKQTGAVVITWATQSELNNAGFFIKRSQQRDGEFKVINATMIAGAGTTSEKQTYTYTDTTAQPNVVYYYQIEDVSLDGQRQTLTLGTRLKGHIGAAGKATVIWGELKSSNE